MKTYFVSSDIHGFFKEWQNALKDAGFDINNNEHILILLGDLFDRGKEPWEIYTFIKSLPNERTILIKGNHEYLLLELVKRRFPFHNDYSNGTYYTLISLYKDPVLEQRKWIDDNLGKYDRDELFDKSREIIRKTESELYCNEKIKEIVEWINSPRWMNYYELGKYIFVHSFIPLVGITGVYSDEKYGKYYPGWRDETSDAMWEAATWGCPYRHYLLGHFKEEEEKGKILVCGHWHTSDFYNNLLYENEPEKILDIKKSNPIFVSDKYPGLIGIDACTALTKKVNVLVLKI